MFVKENQNIKKKKSDLYTDLFINRIIELENQLSEKNAIINYLTMQLIPKSQDKTICSCNHNTNHKIKINKDKGNSTQLDKKKIHQTKP